MDKLDSNRRITLSPAEESSLAGWLAHQINASERGSTSARRPHPHRDWDARSTTRTCIFVGAWHCFRGSFAAHMWAGESAALLTDEIPVPKGRAPCVRLSVSFVLSFARSRVLSRSFHAPRPIRSGSTTRSRSRNKKSRGVPRPVPHSVVCHTRRTRPRCAWKRVFDMLCIWHIRLGGGRTSLILTAPREGWEDRGRRCCICYPLFLSFETPNCMYA